MDFIGKEETPSSKVLWELILLLHRTQLLNKTSSKEKKGADDEG
jgi:hypothetical protein